MSGSLCIHCCFKSFGRIRLAQRSFEVARYHKGNYLHALNRISYCTKAKVPPDVLISRANEFRGERYTVFESEEVQTILKRMTGVNIDKIYKSRKEELSNPKYLVLNDEQLRKENEKILLDAERRLTMPPIRGLRKKLNVVITQDEELIQGDEDGASYIFTDISPKKDPRAILVRENSTGTLREANWDERDRMQFIYWPREGQTYEIAPMLLDENLPSVFDQLRHEDVLDIIHVQFEIDAPDFIRVSHQVYEDIMTRDMYDILKSTRHYGGMIFYYVRNQKTSTVFSFFVQNGRIEDAADIVRLHALINSDFECSESSNEGVIKEFIEHNDLDHLLNEYIQPTPSGEEQKSIA